MGPTYIQRECAEPASGMNLPNCIRYKCAKPTSGMSVLSLHPEVGEGRSWLSQLSITTAQSRHFSLDCPLELPKGLLRVDEVHNLALTN